MGWSRAVPRLSNTGVYKYKTILLAYRKDNGDAFVNRLRGGGWLGE